MIFKSYIFYLASLNLYERFNMTDPKILKNKIELEKLNLVTSNENFIFNYDDYLIYKPITSKVNISFGIHKNASTINIDHRFIYVNNNDKIKFFSELSVKKLRKLQQIILFDVNISPTDGTKIPLDKILDLTKYITKIIKNIKLQKFSRSPSDDSVNDKKEVNISIESERNVKGIYAIYKNLNDFYDVLLFKQKNDKWYIEKDEYWVDLSNLTFKESIKILSVISKQLILSQSYNVTTPLINSDILHQINKYLIRNFKS